MWLLFQASSNLTKNHISLIFKPLIFLYFSNYEIRMNLKIIVALTKVVIFFTLKSKHAENPGTSMEHCFAAMPTFSMAERTTLCGKAVISD